MTIEQKKNDWLATNFFSPDKSFEEFAALGITPDNSSLQNEDYYTKLPDIQEAFKTDSGDFDSAKFHKYYQEILKSYNTVEAENLNASLLDFYEYDPNNYFAPMDSKVADVAPRMVQFANPDRRSRGLVNLHEISAPTMSAREVAQQNRVFNVETGEFEDWTPNDWGGLKAITRPALVLAQWDEDGVHEVNGRQIKHKKGDLKYNELGDTYYETLGKRDLAGKDILHISDTLSVDGSKWNKYDFFDSDGIDKSVAGTIAKTVTKMIPMFIPYGVGTAYGAMTAAIELGKTFPVLYKALAGIASGDLSNSKSAQAANEMQAWFSKFDSSTSDKGKQGFFTLENLGTVIADSSKQLFQQRTLAKIPELLSKGNITDKTMKWGKGISLAYMAATSTTDSYDAFKEAGANDRVAGLGMLASGLAMYGLMQGNYFGITDHMFRGTYLDKQPVTKAIKTAAKDIVDKNINKNVASPKEAANWVLKSTKKLKDAFAKIDASEIMKDSLAEGTEEVIEEVSGDAVKAFFKGLNAVGLIDKDQEYNFGFSVKDMASRYATAFGGGAIGGAVFHLQGKYENWFNTNIRNKKPIEMAKEDPDSLKALIYLFQQGKGKEARAELERLHDKGKLGSTNLSGVKFDISKDDSGKYSIEYKAAENGESQNDIVYGKLSDYFDWVENTLVAEGLNLSEEQIKEASIVFKEGFGQDLSEQEIRQKIAEINTIQFLNYGVYSQVFEDWNKLTENILTTKGEIEAMFAADNQSSENADFEARKEAVKNNARFKELTEKLKTLRQERDDLVSGKKSDLYFGQWKWILNPTLVSKFVKTFGKDNFVKEKYNKYYDELSDDEKKVADSAYAEYSRTKEKQEVLDAYWKFIDIEEKLGTKLEVLANTMKDSSALFVPGHTVFSFMEKNLRKRSEEIARKRVELQKQIDENVEDKADKEQELERLNLEQKDINAQFEKLASNPVYLMQRELSEQGKESLHRPLYNMHLDEFNVYAQSYLENLEKVAQDGLYSDQSDPDLEAIMQQYVRNLGSNVDEMSENIRMAFNAQLAHVAEDYFPEGMPEFDVLASYLSEIAVAINNGNYKALSEIKRNFEENHSEIKEAIASYLEDTDISVEQLIDSVTPKIGGMSLFDFVEKVSTIKSTLKKSPIYDIIKTLSEIDGGFEPLVDTLDSQILAFLRSDSLDDYFIKDPKVINKLERLNGILDLAAGLIEAHLKDGFNDSVNMFRKTLGKELFGHIDRDVAMTLASELDLMKRRLDTLLTIARQNSFKSLSKQMDIETNMRRIWFADFSDPKSIINGNISRQFDIDVEKILQDSGYDPNNSPEENLAAQVKFENGLYQAVSEKAQEKGWTENMIAERIVNCFSDTKAIINGRPTKLNDDPENKISAHDQFVYLTMILAAPSQNFHAQFKSVIDNSTDKAPTFGQEYAARLLWSKVQNPELFNLTMSALIAKLPKDSSLYMKTKSILDNVHIYGGAGVGKTRGVASWVKNMFPEAGIITCAPTDVQVENLNQAIDHGKGPSYTKEELLRFILDRKDGSLFSDDDVVEITEEVDDKKKVVGITTKANVKISDSKIFTESNPTILFIDEVGVFNRIELEIIHRYAKKHNILVFGFGDYKQNSDRVDFFGKKQYSNMEDCFVFYAPELVAPFRPGNAAQLDNYNAMTEALDSAYDIYYENPEIPINELDKFVSEKYGTNPILLKWFQSDGDFGGIKFDNTKDVATHVNFLKGVLDRYPSTDKSGKNKICIVADKVSDFQSIEGVDVITPDKVQGSEYDFVIIESGLGKRGNGGAYSAVKDLYTLSQRATRGVIVASEAKAFARSIEDPSSAIDIRLSDEQIKKFIEWKKKLYSKISDEVVDGRVVNVDREPTPNPNPSPNPSGDSDDHEENPTPQPNPPTPKEKDIQYKEFGEKKSIETGTKRCISKHFYEWWENPEKNTNKIPFNEFWRDSDFLKDSGLSEKDLKKVHHILRAYYLYGHYKEDKFETLKDLLGFWKGEKPRLLTEEACRNAKFEVKEFLGSKILCATIESNPKLTIPLLSVEGARIGEFKGTITLSWTKDEMYREVDPNKFTKTPIKSIGGSNENVFVFNIGNDHLQDPGTILSGKALEWYTGKGKKYSERSKSGQSFAVVCADPFVTDEDVKEFINPQVDESGKISYATQGDEGDFKKFKLIGAFARATTVESLNSVWDKLKDSQNVVSGTQMGRIITAIIKSEGKDSPTLKKFAGMLFFWQNHDSDPSAIELNYFDQAANKYVREWAPKFESEEEVLEYLKEKVKLPHASIIPWKISEETSYSRSAGYIAKGVFGTKNNPDGHISKLKSYSEIILQSPTFNEGVYINANLLRGLVAETGVWFSAPNNVEYYSDVTRVWGDSFAVSTEGISEQDVKDDETLSKVNAWFKANGSRLGFVPTINRVSEIENAVNWVNSSIKASTTHSPEYVQVKFENGELSLETVEDASLMLANRYTVPVESIQEISTSDSLGFKIFSLSLSGNQQKWIRLNKDNSSKEVSEKYARLAEYAGNVSLSPVHKKYVSTLLNGGDFTNSGKLFGDSVVDPKLLEMVIEYLTEKIENGEC